MLRSVLTVFVASVLALNGAVPRPADELSWKTWDGQTLQISKYKGKIVVLEFLSTTCAHCVFTSKVLSKMQTEFGPKGLQVLGMAVNDDANVTEFVRTQAVNFPMGKNKREEALRFMQHSIMNSFYYPGLLFIDRNGVVQGQYTGSDAFLSESTQERNIRAQIEKLLAAGAPAGTTVVKSRKKAS